MGDTPAVCLTQNLPPEKDANLLLLGCGDIRNILFTAYSGAGINERKLDFTCCDLEPEIIARNVLALTLILDDTKSSNAQLFWNIYYHVFIDADSIALLQAQAEKLLGYARSQRVWQDCPYGTMIHFCDSGTLANVVKLWELYALRSSDEKEYNELQRKLEKQWDAAKQRHNRLYFEGNTKRSNGSEARYPPLEGLRSWAPLASHGIVELDRLHLTYWRNGTCFIDDASTETHGIANPMFTCLRSGVLLHPRTIPPLGFHLGIGHARLSAGSPLSHVNEPSAGHVLVQFRDWCTALRRAKLNSTIRYVNCDALAFCHVVQLQRSNRMQLASPWYRGCWTFDAMELSEDEYGEHGTAPTTFDVIDTSDLMECLGSLNVLAAAAPLLSALPSSVIRTEMLAQGEKSVASSATNLLSGDLPTMALLLGLKAVQYWTDAIATWHINESLLLETLRPIDESLQETPQECGDKIIKALSRHIVLWKLADYQHVKYDASELAAVFMRTYLEMFQSEMLVLTSQKARVLFSSETYSRGGLAVVLGLTKRANTVSWDFFIKEVVNLMIQNDDNAETRLRHLQSFLVHLDMFGLLPLERIQPFEQYLSAGLFKKWTNIPTVLCLTLVVPHSKVAMFDGFNIDEIPLCQLEVLSYAASPDHLYTDIKLAFGTVKASGDPYSAEYSISVDEDPRGYQGMTSLIVSAMVSTTSLIYGGNPSFEVVFSLSPTPTSMHCFMEQLGSMLHIHRSFLMNEDVHVTKYRPNMTAHATIQCASVFPKQTDTDFAVTITPRFEPGTTKVTSLQVQYEIRSPEVQMAMQSVELELTLNDPFTLVLEIGEALRHELKLPLPLDGPRGKVTDSIGRGLGHVEYQAPVVELAVLARHADSVFPVMRDFHSSPVLEHLHYVSPQTLPKLYIGAGNTATQWIHDCTSITASTWEYSSLKHAVASGTDLPGRLGVKRSIVCMYTHIFGFRGSERVLNFSLHTPSGEIAKILVDAVRMDVSNQTVFIDAAIIPSYSETSTEIDRIVLSTMYDQKIVPLEIEPREILFWFHLLPAFVERCRSWTHKSACEYKAKGATIPLSTKSDEKFMCTCGMGVFPNDWLKNLKQFGALRKYAVRAAIPVVYASPMSPGTRSSAPKELAKPKPVVPNRLIPKFPESKPKPTPRVENPRAKKFTCFVCGAEKAKTGRDLWKCGGCMFARYCSTDCQKGDWMNGHKLICKQLKK